MKNILFIIDPQNDFCGHMGALRCENAQQAVDNICELLNINEFDEIVCTKDTHYNEDPSYFCTKEGLNLPTPHCIKDTSGWRIHKDIYDALYKHEWYTMEKNQFMLTPNQLSELEEDYEGEECNVFVCGFATDICVISNALALNNTLQNADVFLIEPCCAGTTDTAHEKAVEIMKTNQIEIIRTTNIKSYLK